MKARLIVAAGVLFLSWASFGLIPMMARDKSMHGVLKIYPLIVIPIIATALLVFVIELLKALSNAKRGRDVFVLIFFCLCVIIFASLAVGLLRRL